MAAVNTLDLPYRKREHYDLKLYKDAAGEFRWRLTDERNNRIIGAATEGYKNLGDCIGNAWLVTGWLPEDFDLEAVWEDDAYGAPNLGDDVEVSVPEPARLTTEDPG